MYISKRIKGIFHKALLKQNQVIKDKVPDKSDLEQFQSSINPYLGIMKHYHTHNLAKRMIFTKMDNDWWHYVYLSGYNKFVMKTLK